MEKLQRQCKQKRKFHTQGLTKPLKTKAERMEAFREDCLLSVMSDSVRKMNWEKVKPSAVKLKRP
jgi:hypothetical protein